MKNFQIRTLIYIIQNGHIINQYKLKEKYREKIAELESVQNDDRIIIKSLEDALARAQNKFETAERSIAGQKGAKNRYVNVFSCCNIYIYIYI
jgi:glutamine phosphoribosylpyrophosphate amidotransferase